MYVEWTSGSSSSPILAYHAQLAALLTQMAQQPACNTKIITQDDESFTEDGVPWPNRTLCAAGALTRATDVSGHTGRVHSWHTVV